MKYNFKKIEPKWQAKWEESKVFEAKDNSDKPKFYGCLIRGNINRYYELSVS